MSGVLRIKKWSDFQHYRHRSPPWIRFYRSVLDPQKTPWYRGLSDNAWRWLTELWLLASEHGGIVTYDSILIIRATGRTMRDKPLLDAALRELASAGALTIAGADASADFLAMLPTEGREER